MPRVLRFGIVLVLLAVALVVRAKAAVGADADLQFQLGTLLFDETRYWEALQAFDRATHTDDAALAASDGPLGAYMRASLDKAGIHTFGKPWEGVFRQMCGNTRPIVSPTDLKGLKVRVMGNPMFVDMMNALGGNGVAMGYDQVFSALQTGVVDGAENNPPSFVFDNHYQVAKYYTLTEHLIVPEILVRSRKTWDQLSKDDQALIMKFGREAQLEERALWAKYENDAMEKAKAAGIQITQIDDKAPFQDAVKPVWDKYGPKYADIIKRIEAVE